MGFETIMQFWFEQHGSKQWWKKDPAFDALCRQRFLGLHGQAVSGELADWRQRPEGRLAEIIVLDQLSRNIFRDTARAFAYDAIALVLAQEAVRVGADGYIPRDYRQFVYMPYMHSESARVHTWAMGLFADLGSDQTLEFERRHKAIIDRFGRYPHRNEIVGRESTPEEIEFLLQPGSSF